MLFGPLALLMVVNHTLYRRLRDARSSSESADIRQAPRRMLRRNDISMTQSMNPVSGGGISRRPVLVGAHEVRRRYSGPISARASPADASDEEYEALLGNLQRCLTPAAVGAVFEDISSKGLCGHRQLGAILDCLVDLEACEADAKSTLACGGLAVAGEVNALRRVIKLKFDPVSGHMDWHHVAVRSVGFCMSGSSRRFFLKPNREQMRLRAAIHLDRFDRVIGWDLRPESTTRT